MVSEESNENSTKEKNYAFNLNNGGTPMIRVSADILKEFRCPVPQQGEEKVIELSAKESEKSDFHLSSLESDLKQVLPINSSNATSYTNGIPCVPGKLQEDGDVSDKQEKSLELNGEEVDARHKVSSFLKSPETHFDPCKEKRQIPFNSNTLNDDAVKSVSTHLSAKNKLTNQSAQPEVAQGLLSSTPSKNVTESGPQKKNTDSTGKSKNSMNVITELSASDKGSAKESLIKDSYEEKIDDELPGTPLSETQSQISLEEALLKDNATSDDQEIDELSEERLLQEDTNLEKDAKNDLNEVNIEGQSEKARSLLLFDDTNDSSELNGSQNTSSSLQGNKSITKILQELDSSIDERSKCGTGSSPKGNSESEDSKKENYAEETLVSLGKGETSYIKENKSLNGENYSSHSIQKTLTEEETLVSLGKGETSYVKENKSLNGENYSSHSIQKTLTDSGPLEENSDKENVSIQKENTTADLKEDDTDTAVSRKNSSGVDFSFDDTPLSLRVTLKSIAKEKLLTGDNSVSIVQPSKEIQRMKRPLTPDLSSDPKPNLKKIRIFREKSENSKGVGSPEVENVKVDLKRISRHVESLRAADCRLQEVEFLQKKSNSEKPLTTNKDFVDRKELERRTALELRNPNNNKLKRIKRKDLESLVMEMFVDKVMYEHQLGQQKDLCKRLEVTLETNRKKAAQFHKEIDDLKIVTRRLQTEHNSKKSQVVGPIRVKRSVGIQATPTIIGKGIMQATTNKNTNFRILVPSQVPSIPFSESSKESKSDDYSQVRHSHEPLSIVPVQSKATTTSQNSPLKIIHCPIPPKSTNDSVTPVRNLVEHSTNAMQQVASTLLGNIPSQSGTVPPTQMVILKPIEVQQPKQLSPLGAVAVTHPVPPACTTQRVWTTLASLPLGNPTSTVSSVSTTQLQNVGVPPSSTRSGVIDLTNDDEGAKTSKGTIPAGSIVAFQRPPGANINQNTPAAQFVPVKPSPSVNQLLLVPSSLGQPTTALMVNGTAKSNSQTSKTLGTTIMPQVVTATTASPTTHLPSPATVIVGSQVNGSNFITSIARHPAPLPKPPSQQLIGYSKPVPPGPVLKLSSKKSCSVTLSWNMSKNEDHDPIASYQLFAYQEGLAVPSLLSWKKVGSVRALELPMACTLTQFVSGHVYHFAVRAVDVQNRVGFFSDPRTIRLGK